MKILIDVSGADKGLSMPIKAVCNVVDNINAKIILVGIKKDIINTFKNLKSEKYIDKVDILECEEYITNLDDPVKSIKFKKNSNLVVAFEYLKNNENVAFISASNTGALMAGGLLKIGRIKGISRPALLSILPGKYKNIILLDSGINPLAKAENIIDYSKLGVIYSEKVLNVDNPKIALLNIGAEEKKGTDTLKEVYSILKETEKNFIGNVESRYILTSDADIIVCDGLMGNVAIKSLEGAISLILKEISAEFKKSIGNKIVGILAKPILKNSLRKYDYNKVGGAMIIGIKKPVIKVHGSSNYESYISAIHQSIKILENDINHIIEDNVKKM